LYYEVLDMPLEQMEQLKTFKVSGLSQTLAPKRL